MVINTVQEVYQQNTLFEQYIFPHTFLDNIFNILFVSQQQIDIFIFQKIIFKYNILHSCFESNIYHLKCFFLHFQLSTVMLSIEIDASFRVSRTAN